MMLFLWNVNKLMWFAWNESLAQNEHNLWSQNKNMTKHMTVNFKGKKKKQKKEWPCCYWNKPLAKENTFILVILTYFKGCCLYDIDSKIINENSRHSPKLKNKKAAVLTYDKNYCPYLQCNESQINKNILLQIQE